MLARTEPCPGQPAEPSLPGSTCACTDWTLPSRTLTAIASSRSRCKHTASHPSARNAASGTHQVGRPRNRLAPLPSFPETCRLGAAWSIEQHGVVGRQLCHMASGTVTEGGSRGTAPSRRRGLGKIRRSRTTDRVSRTIPSMTISADELIEQLGDVPDFLIRARDAFYHHGSQPKAWTGTPGSPFQEDVASGLAGPGGPWGDKPFKWIAETCGTYLAATVEHFRCLGLMLKHGGFLMSPEVIVPTQRLYYRNISQTTTNSSRRRPQVSFEHLPPCS